MQTIVGTEFLDLVANALERMAFLLVARGSQEPAAALAGCEHAAVIEIDGASGRSWLLLAGSPGLLAAVAGGMLGEEPASVDLAVHGGATAAELANVIGGELVIALGGRDQPLRLGLPLELDREAAKQRLASQQRHPSAGGFAGVLQGDEGLLVLAFHAA